MRKLHRTLTACGVVLGLVLTAGCPSNQPQRLPDNGSDPLLGPDAPSLPKPGGAVAPTGPQARLNGPLPITQQTSSTAEMASGPLKGGRDTIAIPVTDTSGKKSWQANDGTKPVLNPPQPIAENLKPIPNVPTGVSPELQRELDKRNVVYHNQEAIPGGVRFKCLVGNPTVSATIREYEVDAPTLDAAVRAILTKIDQPR